ncbi:chemotaxis protein MotC [Microvirga puerhi]|uniref:Chemotaxis protein MotC n=1 Tax=Microvirga puerhi TaxID=2876078 RepID=A0ABS7VSP3_9HYPH|nr:chemotaxis protein MotC [Microvirga puerhi]MBZ6078574.1 chemotaxis protein MotC [Microvirga puerhi]
MSGPLRFFVLIVLVWPTLCVAKANAESAEIDAQPVELVRTLQALQDQIAAGSTNAHVAQRVLLDHIDERLLAMEPAVWQAPKSIRAAIIYVLSGGKPGILKKILSLSDLPKSEGLLAQGALAYVEGREEDAQKILADVDVRTLPATLSGQIALVQAALTLRDGPEKSVSLLDFARLQLPGTLVEEAALRREIFVVAQLKDTEKFDALSRQYLRRFRYSVYSGNFRQRFASALTRLDVTKDPDYFKRLVATLNELEPAGRLELYLMVARAAINQGQTQAAVLATDKANELAMGDASSSARSKLYRAAAIIVTSEGFDEGATELKKLDRSLLPASDLELLDSALAMATYIRRVPEGGVPSLPRDQAQIRADNVVQKPTAIISRAQEVLGAIDQLVRKESR